MTLFLDAHPRSAILQSTRKMQKNYVLIKQRRRYQLSSNGRQGGRRSTSQVLFSNGIRSTGFTQCEHLPSRFLGVISRAMLILTSEGHPGVFRAIIHVRPGTHHVRFIVDTVMQCSLDLPTTVDFGNNLVNYIEVNADDIPSDTLVASEATSALAVVPEDPNEPKPVDSKIADKEKSKASKPPAKTKPVLPPGRYSSQVPQYLVDLDKAEDSIAYQYAAAAIEKLPTPPSLPGFLGKPILNAATPMKDDNSVLTMPNHTVLNHLATSSIKNNVLAVSATTRYKRKVCHFP